MYKYIGKYEAKPFIDKVTGLKIGISRSFNVYKCEKDNKLYERMDGQHGSKMEELKYPMNLLEKVKTEKGVV